MVNLFSSSSRRRSNNYQGFSKYHEEVSRYSPQPPDQFISASAAQGASAAAAAALRGSNATPRPTASQRHAANVRANSLSSGGNKYVYTPKASYHTGPSNTKRTSSLTNAPRSNSMRRMSIDEIVHEDFDGNHDSQVVETTTTTSRVLDAQGRTQSITTKTIRTLADGSNIIETSTKNISRGNSRTNSMRGSRTGSILSSQANQVNLDKIDEDLHDFDYNYLDNKPLQLNNHHPTIKETPVQSPPLRPVDVRANSLSSATSAPLRSILKNTPRPGDEVANKNHSPQKRSVSSQEDAEVNSPGGSIQFSNTVETHTYYDNTPRKRQSTVPPQQQQLQQQQQQPKRNTQGIATASSSAVPSSDFYQAALEAAHRKVYGDRELGAPAVISSPKSPTSASGDEDDPQLFSKTYTSPKVDSLMIASQAAMDEGIQSNYNYENHHKSFVGTSLRDGVPRDTSRKEREREHKRQQKEAKANAKAAAKQQAEEAKAQAKAEEQEAKAQAKADEQRAKADEQQAKAEQNEQKRVAREESSKGVFGLFRRRSIQSETSNEESNTPVGRISGDGDLGHSNSFKSKFKNSGQKIIEKFEVPQKQDTHGKLPNTDLAAKEEVKKEVREEAVVVENNAGEISGFSGQVAGQQPPVLHTPKSQTTSQFTGHSPKVTQSPVGQPAVGQVSQPAVGQYPVGQLPVGQSGAGQSPIGQNKPVFQSGLSQGFNQGRPVFSTGQRPQAYPGNLSAQGYPQGKGPHGRPSQGYPQGRPPQAYPQGGYPQGGIQGGYPRPQQGYPPIASQPGFQAKAQGQPNWGQPQSHSPGKGHGYGQLATGVAGVTGVASTGAGIGMPNSSSGTAPSAVGYETPIIGTPVGTRRQSLPIATESNNTGFTPGYANAAAPVSASSNAGSFTGPTNSSKSPKDAIKNAGEGFYEKYEQPTNQVIQELPAAQKLGTNSGTAVRNAKDTVYDSFEPTDKVIGETVQHPPVQKAANAIENAGETFYEKYEEPADKAIDGIATGTKTSQPVKESIGDDAEVFYENYEQPTAVVLEGLEEQQKIKANNEISEKGVFGKHHQPLNQVWITEPEYKPQDAVGEVATVDTKPAVNYVEPITSSKPQSKLSPKSLPKKAKAAVQNAGENIFEKYEQPTNKVIQHETEQPEAQKVAVNVHNAGENFYEKYEQPADKALESKGNDGVLAATTTPKTPIQVKSDEFAVQIDPSNAGQINSDIAAENVKPKINRDYSQEFVDAIDKPFGSVIPTTDPVGVAGTNPAAAAAAAAPLAAKREESAAVSGVKAAEEAKESSSFRHKIGGLFSRKDKKHKKSTSVSSVTSGNISAPIDVVHTEGKSTQLENIKDASPAIGRDFSAKAGLAATPELPKEYSSLDPSRGKPSIDLSKPVVATHEKTLINDNVVKASREQAVVLHDGTTEVTAEEAVQYANGASKVKAGAAVAGAAGVGIATYAAFESENRQSAMVDFEDSDDEEEFNTPPPEVMQNDREFESGTFDDHGGRVGELAIEDGKPELAIQDAKHELAIEDGKAELAIQDGTPELAIPDAKPALTIQDEKPVTVARGIETSVDDGKPIEIARDLEASEFSVNDTSRNLFIKEEIISEKDISSTSHKAELSDQGVPELSHFTNPASATAVKHVLNFDDAPAKTTSTEFSRELKDIDAKPRELEIEDSVPEPEIFTSPELEVEEAKSSLKIADATRKVQLEHGATEDDLAILEATNAGAFGENKQRSASGAFHLHQFDDGNLDFDGDSTDGPIPVKGFKHEPVDDAGAAGFTFVHSKDSPHATVTPVLSPSSYSEPQLDGIFPISPTDKNLKVVNPTSVNEPSGEPLVEPLPDPIVDSPILTKEVANVGDKIRVPTLDSIDDEINQSTATLPGAVSSDITDPVGVVEEVLVPGDHVFSKAQPEKEIAGSAKPDSLPNPTVSHTNQIDEVSVESVYSEPQRTLDGYNTRSESNYDFSSVPDSRFDSKPDMIATDPKQRSAVPQFAPPAVAASQQGQVSHGAKPSATSSFYDMEQIIEDYGEQDYSLGQKAASKSRFSVDLDKEVERQQQVPSTPPSAAKRSSLDPRTTPQSVATPKVSAATAVESPTVGVPYTSSSSAATPKTGPYTHSPVATPKTSGIPYSASPAAASPIVGASANTTKPFEFLEDAEPPKQLDHGSPLNSGPPTGSTAPTNHQDLSAEEVVNPPQLSVDYPTEEAVEDSATQTSKKKKGGKFKKVILKYFVNPQYA